MDVADIDLSDMGFWERPWTERDAAFAALRAQRPIAFFEEPELPSALVDLGRGPGYFAVTRHADVQEVSRHPERFCSSRGATSIPDLPPEMLEFFGGMINEDDPRHSRLRRIVSAAFNPRVIRSVEDTIAAVAADIVDRLVATGECDFVTEVAARLPLQIICDMMGVPAADYQRVFECSNVILSAGDPEYVAEGTDVVGAFLQAGAELSELMQGLARARSTDPTDDVTSALVNANVDGEALSHAELASFFILLVVAGNETTRQAITHGAWALMEHPDQLEMLQEEPERMSVAVEEILRWASPILHFRRTATRDVTVRGQQISAGDKVVFWFVSANRDEEVFSDPFRFDVMRDPNDHMAFGKGGPHTCLGAYLARLELRVLFEEAAPYLSRIEIAGQPRYLRSNFTHGIKSLPVRRRV